MDSHELEILHLTTAMRTHMMDTLTDADLAFKFPNNPTLGELCRDIGNTERLYIDSFKTLKMAWGTNSAEAGVENSVARLKAWYKALDDEFDTVLNAIPQSDMQSKKVDRSGGFMLPLGAQFHVYREALLIFYSKATVYLCAMGKPLSQQWREWIG